MMFTQEVKGKHTHKYCAFTLNGSNVVCVCVCMCPVLSSVSKAAREALGKNEPAHCLLMRKSCVEGSCVCVCYCGSVRPSALREAQLLCCTSNNLHQHSLYACCVCMCVCVCERDMPSLALSLKADLSL
jgi:hypothetical protein